MSKMKTILSTPLPTHGPFEPRQRRAHVGGDLPLLLIERDLLTVEFVLRCQHPGQACHDRFVLAEAFLVRVVGHQRGSSSSVGSNIFAASAHRTGSKRRVGSFIALSRAIVSRCCSVIV
jgi:hypothetical protein